MTATALERLAGIAWQSSVDGVWALATAHFRELGFARLNYGLTRFRNGRSIGDPEDVLYLSTGDPAYRERYFQSGLYARTPQWRWMTHNVGATTWRWVHDDLAAGRLSADEAEAVRVNIGMGVIAGITISYPDATNRTKAALGMIADPGLGHDEVDAIWARARAEIEAVANMMHLRILSLPTHKAGRSLTPRQREVLEWVADGKTTQDIALLIGVSAAMVEKHLRLARAALDVDTTAQAVAKGTILNLIFTHDPGSAVQA